MDHLDHSPPSPTPHPLAIALLTVSDSRTAATDRSGQFLAHQVTQGGYCLREQTLVSDDRYQVRAIVSRWIADPQIQVIITTGGTGPTGRDITPEAVQVLLDKELPGFGELFRWLSYGEIKTATIQSRALGGVANGTYVFCLPGSTAACRLAWEQLIAPQFNPQDSACNLVSLLPRLAES
ncbi:molybdenum cofactor biosynthesis protein B [Prochlorothrix hollandica]|uniref:Molybdenum cofactor biosynthesis protein B n=1 Tax=Prochlorothrix hollandica PCC 9006 = CALU 1027 TaxID=317619 RepID=A0A0M2PZT6_PROHO|nr:molybdenum cofactor biosynthesis protein B [Prochlorothrix hollandica]KKI99891.1 molybdopterin biosynthesis protein B [Prochlorothrix hollandica PCC 9006 = CALU 1027]